MIRINSPPVRPRRYGAHTGHRTDVLVSAFDYRVHTATPLPVRVVFLCHPKFSGPECWDGISADGMFRVSPGLVRRVRRFLGVLPWPWTGLVAFELANLLCDEVRAFGFGADGLFSNCTHYYNVVDGQPFKCAAHQFGGLSGVLHESISDHRAYVLNPWHDLRREAMLMKDHPYTRPPEARLRGQ